MESLRKTGIIVGVLFITATVAGILLAVLLDPLLSGSEGLSWASENESQVMIGALFYSIMAVAVAGIAVAIYPILREHNESLAVGYLGARIVEGVLFLVNVVTILALLALSQEFVKAGAPAASHYETSSALWLAAGNGAYLLGFGLAFTLSALMLNFVLYRSKLVPRWLSVWGFVGAALVFVFYSLQFFGVSQIEVLFAPIALQEMVFAVWLIVKGFNSPATATP